VNAQLLDAGYSEIGSAYPLANGFIYRLIVGFLLLQRFRSEEIIEKELMNKFDIIVLAVVGLSILCGIWKGLLRQVVGLIGVAAGYMIAMHLYGAFAAKFLRGFSPTTGHIIAFVSIFIACIIAASIIGWMIGSLMSITGLGILNRIGGALLGGAKGCFILAAVVMMLTAFLPPDSGVFEGSRTVRYIQPMAGVISTIAPKSIKTKYDQKTARMGSVSNKGN
jgi:membrane protein required for colicin V production